jgi:predicted KAP-like P-loop ATPase
VAVVYVNTWQFEGYDDAKSAILSAVLLELAHHKRFGPKIRDAAFGLLKNVNWMRFAKLTLKHVAAPAAAAFFTGGLSAVPTAVAVSTGLAGLTTSDKDTADSYGNNAEVPDCADLLKTERSQAGIDGIRDFRNRFGQMLKDGGIDTLVVLVDDLDRCTPERIIENLEAVKLFLSADQTVFVIGADRRIVEHAIRDKYAQRVTEGEDREESERLVKDYLEKLVQIPYSLPRLSTTEIGTYMTLLFCQRHLPDNQFSKCVDACDVARAKNRYGTFGYADVKAMLGDSDLDGDLKEALTFCTASAPLIADGLKGNPRQVKRFLNALLLRKQLAAVAQLTNVKEAVLVKLMILEYAYPELFTELFAWQSQQGGHPSQLAQLEAVLSKQKPDEAYDELAKGTLSKWAGRGPKRWVAMSPQLQDVDLRDYFWVARDRLESTFSGVAMIPPAVRVVLDGLTSGVAPKRNAAMKSARSLTPDERHSLVEAIEQRITRQPEDQAGYDSLRYLIEADIEEAAMSLVRVLTQRPLERVPPAIGMQVATLYKAKPSIRPNLMPLCEQLSQSSTKVGKAYQESQKMKKPR